MQATLTSWLAVTKMNQLKMEDQLQRRDDVAAEIVLPVFNVYNQAIRCRHK